VPVERTWDAESVFATVSDWEHELEGILAFLPEVKAFQGRLDGPATAAAALAARDELSFRLDKVYVYAYLVYAVETTDPRGVAMLDRARGVRGQALAAAAFVEPELLALGADTLAGWVETEPALATYAAYVDDLVRRAPHTRSDEVEELLGMLAEPFAGPSLVQSALVDTDLVFRPAHGSDGAEHPVTQGTIDALLADADPAVRQSAWESFADGHLSVRHALAATLIASVRQDVLTARVRRHPSSLAASLHRSNIPTSVLDGLLEEFQRNLPTWHRYWGVRRRMLGRDAFSPWDVHAPLGSTTPLFSYEQCVEWICESLAPLGADYADTVRRGCLEERWVDVYPTVGKVGGAFSWGAPGTHPFIVMSFDGTAVSLGTLAHELGHSMHSYLTWQTQPEIYSDYSLFAAEVASNFHQAMLRSHLLETVTDREVRLAVLDEAMANLHRYLFVMPTLARLERELHERVEAGAGVTADWLSERTMALFAEAFGPEVELDAERVGIIWAQFGHLFASFYVYAYATGISGAHSLARRVLDGGADAAERYRAFLSAGSSLYPLDALRRAGVDLESREPVTAAFATLAAFVDEVEALA
jgi:oligoendopeptidase F